MLFQGLNKLKRKSIMTAVMLMALGLILVIWPREYTAALIQIVSGVLIVRALVMVFEYIDSRKTLVDYLLLGLALIIAIVGMVMMIADVDVLGAISWIFGILMIIDGLHSATHALMYARRSGRRFWWILVVLSAILMALGVLIICHPWWNTADTLLRATGWMTVGASLVGILRLIWVWPFKYSEEED